MVLTTNKKRIKTVILILVLVLNYYLFNPKNLECNILPSFILNSYGGILLYLIAFILTPVLFGKKTYKILLSAILLYDFIFLICNLLITD